MFNPFNWLKAATKAKAKAAFREGMAEGCAEAAQEFAAALEGIAVDLPALAIADTPEPAPTNRRKKAEAA